MTKTPIALAVLSALGLALAPLVTTAQGQMQSPPPQSSQSMGGEQKSFLELDRDLDGKITQEEADQSPMLKAGFQQADSNQDGGLDASEFSAFVAQSGSDMGSGSMQSGMQPDFQQLDINRDGSLTPDEAQSHEMLWQQYTTVDQDQDGTISEVEFSAFEAQQGGQSTGAQQSFEQLDRNRDGYLSAGEASSDQRLSEQFSSVDANRDGWISTQEYQANMDSQGQGQGGVASFETLDQNKDGAISQSEASTDTMLSQQFRQYDRDQNGYLDQAEFSAFEAAQSGMGTTPPPQ